MMHAVYDLHQSAQQIKDKRIGVPAMMLITCAITEIPLKARMALSTVKTVRLLPEALAAAVFVPSVISKMPMHKPYAWNNPVQTSSAVGIEIPT
jgi:hypothetical protein